MNPERILDQLICHSTDHDQLFPLLSVFFVQICSKFLYLDLTLTMRGDKCFHEGKLIHTTPSRGLYIIGLLYSPLAKGMVSGTTYHLLISDATCHLPGKCKLHSKKIAFLRDLCKVSANVTKFQWMETKFHEKIWNLQDSISSSRVSYVPTEMFFSTLPNLIYSSSPEHIVRRLFVIYGTFTGNFVKKRFLCQLYIISRKHIAKNIVELLLFNTFRKKFTDL